MRRRSLQATLILCLIYPVVSFAHTPSESFSRWEFNGNTLSMQFTVTAREVSRIPHPQTSSRPAQALADYLSQRIIIGDESIPCMSLQSLLPVDSQPGYVRLEASWRCEALPGSVTIEAFFDLAAEHVHFASLEIGEDLRQALLTAENPVWVLSESPIAHYQQENSSTGFTSYLILGFWHILGGLDHVVFLAGLMLLCRRTRDVIWAISGFTLGHSISLSLASLGLVQVQTTAIEATIGLTIALVAVEGASKLQRSALPLALASFGLLALMIPLSVIAHGSLGASGLAGLALFSFCYVMASRDVGNSPSFRLVATALFGLIHGFGFAGAFQAANMGARSLLLPLAGFNVGVEIGQLTVWAFLILLGVLAQRISKRWVATSTDVVTAAVCCCGVFWLVQRNFL